MSWNLADHPDCPEHGGGAVDLLIIPRARDLGGFAVRRALPSPKRQMVGPFIFFDQVGPADFASGGRGIDVRPHPHIGLGTVTYLYRGEFQHRDSLGTDQMIYPGEVNWMIAGRGVTHSERTSAETRRRPHQLFGIQTWIALPEQHEEMAPAFEHHKAAALPVIEAEGAVARLILGTAWGEASPVTMLSETFYVDATLQPGAALPLPDNHEDRGIHIAEGEITVAGERYTAGQMLLFRPGDRISVRAGAQGARLLLFGGATMGQSRCIWWNFVSTRKERIEEAREAWRRADFVHGPFRLPPGDDAEYIPIEDTVPRH
jgi:redox-sensitive bicupin YhaK (pirin superfamily)